MCEAARLGAVRDAELAIDVRQVELDGLLGHPELAPDPSIGHPVGYEAQDLELAPRQLLLRLLRA